MPRDYHGVRFGKLTAIKRHSRTGDECYRWLWKCDCGGQKVLHPGSAKATGHCGCDTHANLSARSTIHGMASTAVYKAWAGMKDRCMNPNNSHYAEYGGRGITVCDRWKESFSAFIDDMGPRPHGMTVERENNDGNYEPGNCRWATRKEQQRNNRGNVVISIGIRSQCFTAWCEETGIPYETARARVRRGWTAERAVTVPVDQKHRHTLAKEIQCQH